MSAGLAFAATESAGYAIDGEMSLAALAASKGLLYGCAVTSTALVSDHDFAALVAREAGILVPEGELKRDIVQPQNWFWNFRGGDAIEGFAQAHRQKLRGHTLVWYAAMPRWLERALNENPTENLLTDMIARSCSHFRGRMHSWDVVNEGVAPEEGLPTGLRANSAWYKAFGEGYIATSFHAARDADPQALLLYSDYGIEMHGGWHEYRRSAVLKLLETLKKQNVPIDALGIQAHLQPFKDKFDDAAYARFLRDVESLGLKVMLTELDAADIHGPLDVEKRDAEIAAFVRHFLDVSLASKAMLGILTWGLSDRYSWLSRDPNYKWPDGQLSRGLPYGANLKPKPMRTAIATALSAVKT